MAEIEAGLEASAAAGAAPQAAAQGHLGVGSRVRIPKFKPLGVIRFHGETQFSTGTWVGIELDTAEGKNDGSVQDVSYFTCPPQHGIFVRPDKLTPAEEGDASPNGSPCPSPRTKAKAGANADAEPAAKVRTRKEQAGDSPCHSPRTGTKKERSKADKSAKAEKVDMGERSPRAEGPHATLSPSAGVRYEVVKGPFAGEQGLAWSIEDASGKANLLLDSGVCLRIVAPEDCRALGGPTASATTGTAPAAGASSAVVASTGTAVEPAKAEKEDSPTLRQRLGGRLSLPDSKGSSAVRVVELERDLAERTQECGRLQQRLKEQSEGAQVADTHLFTRVAELEKQLAARTQECSQVHLRLRASMDALDSLRAEMQHMQEGADAEARQRQTKGPEEFTWVGRAAEASSDESEDMHAFDEDLSLLMA